MAPWRQVSLSAHYRYLDRESHFDHHLDTNRKISSGWGYSAFITDRATSGDEVEVKLAWRPLSWLKTSLGYKAVTTEFRVTTDPVPPARFFPDALSDGGQLVAGKYDARTYSLNTTLTPFRRVSFSGTFSYSDTRTRTFANDADGVVPYEGHTYNAIVNSTYVLNEKTDLNTSYSFSSTDYGQNNLLTGLPLGVVYRQHAFLAGVTRRIRDRFLVNLRYGFFNYNESSSGHFNDYTAHAVFVTLIVKTP